MRIVASALLVAALLPGAGCAHVVTTTHLADVDLRSFEEASTSDDWSYGATLTVADLGEDQPLHVTVAATRAHVCTTVYHHVVDRTRVLDRTPERPGWTAAFAIAGILGAGAIGTGIALDATGVDPFISQVETLPHHVPPTFHGQPEAPLFLVIGGALLVPFLAVAIEEGARSTGSAEHQGEYDEVTTAHADCEAEPAASVRVHIDSNGSAIASGTTDDAGRVQLAVPDAAEGALRLVIDGTEGDATDALDALQQHLAERRQARHAREQARAEAERVSRVLARLDEEVANGVCSDTNHAALEQVLAHAVQYAQVMSGGSSRARWHLGDHLYAVATPEGSDFVVPTGIYDEHHVVVVGLYPPTLVVRDADGYPVSTTSAEDTFVVGMDDEHVESRVVVGTSLERLSATISGRGCVLLLRFDVMRW